MAKLELIGNMNVTLSGKENYKIPNDEYFKGMIINTEADFDNSVQLNGKETKNVLNIPNVSLGGGTTITNPSSSSNYKIYLSGLRFKIRE